MKILRVLAVVCSAVALLACAEENDLGKLCSLELDIEDPMLTGGEWDNADCLSGLCFKQLGYRCPSGDESCGVYDQERIWPMCTKACATNADCQASSENINGCETFVCHQGGSMSGPPVSCYCTCLDYIRDSTGVALSQTDFDNSDLICTDP